MTFCKQITHEYCIYLCQQTNVGNFEVISQIQRFKQISHLSLISIILINYSPKKIPLLFIPHPRCQRSLTMTVTKLWLSRLKTIYKCTQRQSITLLITNYECCSKLWVYKNTKCFHKMYGYQLLKEDSKQWFVCLEVAERYCIKCSDYFAKGFII